MARMLCWFTAILLLLWTTAIGTVRGGNVTYDGRSLIINGQHKILFSGSIHYPRSTPDMWSSLISKAKAGGIDVIQTYVFWNLHEPQQGQFYFSGRADLVRFVKEIQAQGLYACLRIGPFIESEWTYGNGEVQRFLVRWVSRPDSDNTWITRDTLQQLDPDPWEYHQSQPALHSTGSSFSNTVRVGGDTRPTLQTTRVYGRR